MPVGGKRPGAGRKKGVPNKATADIKALAQKHGPDALKRLHHLMLHAESEAAQVAASKEILDRAYGKSAQPLTGEGGEGPVRHSLKVSFVKA
jgi:hypothetical protein